jgi:hypothetical protein
MVGTSAKIKVKSVGQECPTHICKSKPKDKINVKSDARASRRAYREP